MVEILIVMVIFFLKINQTMFNLNFLTKVVKDRIRSIVIIIGLINETLIGWLMRLAR